MLVIIPELICEVIIYQDTFEQTDLICILALAMDTGVRLNICNTVLSRFVFHSFITESATMKMEARKFEQGELASIKEQLNNSQKELEQVKGQLGEANTGMFTGCMAPK